MQNEKKYWQFDVEKITKVFRTDLLNGLSKDEIKTRVEQYGLNQLKEAKAASPVALFLGQFNDFIVWVLISASVISGFLKEWIDAVVIIAIVILNAVLGFIQEYRAEKSLQALKKLSSPNSKVIRGGEHQTVPSKEIVPGDLIELEAGDNVPADSRIAWSTSNFSASEASLTGESTPVIKTSIALDEKEIPLAERANMVYMGTSVSAGKARAVVVETGMETELGNIAGMIQGIEEEQTPLQRKLEEFGKWIVYLCFALVGIIFLLGFFHGEKIIDLFLSAVSLAVAAIPEGLPAIVTISLALGVQRMVKRNALIRKLPSVETLGCATVICSDKTGTLTKNEMTVQAVYSDGKLFKVTGIGYNPAGDFLFNSEKISPIQFPGLHKTLVAGVLCNGAQLVRNNGDYKIAGDPTEGAILTLGGKANIWKEPAETNFKFIDEIPFDSERKKMTIIRQQNNHFNAYVKGAPDVLLKDCVFIEDGGKTRKLTEEDCKRINDENDKLAGAAMRVLAVAYKDLVSLPPRIEANSIEKGLVFLGLIAMIDPARPEVKKAMEECKTAGIRTVMITGDHKNTAVAIAKELGFFNENSAALTGEELDKLNEEEFIKKARNISVYARVSPEHKLRIVRVWKKLGEIVAMTGDGVNDAPAVKEADIGVAMGITGTDVTKEVSSMVVTDDNFASIVAAVEEGRGIYDNIKKFIYYLLSCNAGEILVMFFASVFGMPVPLLPIHILWVNLVTDGLPAFALGIDPVDPDIMKRPPLSTDEKIITRESGIRLFTQGLFIGLCSLLTFYCFYYILGMGLVYARTGAFIVLSCTQLFHSFNCRSENESLFKIGVFTNRKLILAAFISFLLQMTTVYLPFSRNIFRTEPLVMSHLAFVIAVSSFPLWAMEAVKFVKSRK